MSSNLERKLNFKSMHETLLNPKLTNNIVISYKETSQKINPGREKPKGYKNYIDLYKKHLLTEESNTVNKIPKGPSNNIPVKPVGKSMNETLKHIYTKRNTTEPNLENFNDRSKAIYSRNSNKNSVSIHDITRLISNRPSSSKNNVINIKRTRRHIDSKENIKIDLRPVNNKSEVHTKQVINNKSTKEKYKLLIKDKSVSTSLMMKGIL
jgi:hypothetical protein